MSRKAIRHQGRSEGEAPGSVRLDKHSGNYGIRPRQVSELASQCQVGFSSCHGEVIKVFFLHGATHSLRNLEKLRISKLAGWNCAWYLAFLWWHLDSKANGMPASVLHSRALW